MNDNSTIQQATPTKVNVLNSDLLILFAYQETLLGDRACISNSIEKLSSHIIEFQ